MSSTKLKRTSTPLESILRRDRAAILAALVAIAVLCWAYIAWLATSPAMAKMDHTPAMMSAQLTNWSPAEFLLMLLMWSVMMVGMMTPSVMPMVLIYARVARQASSCETPFASAGWFASGYFLTWIAFSLVATLLQLALEHALLLSPMMGTATSKLGAALLIGAGVYQWTPLKNSCLTQCQSPLLFIQRQGGFRGQRGAALRLGLHHGTYCIGCCWALMILLFVGGVMNLLWIALLGALVLAEKLIRGRLVARIAGVCLAVAGVALLL